MFNAGNDPETPSATVLPGFNDSHVHFLSGAASLQELDLSGARTLDEVQQRIRDFAAANPGASWIRGRGWNYGPFPGGLPTGASGRVACLLSGGIDSPVAAWRMMRRGCHVVLVHFH